MTALKLRKLKPRDIDSDLYASALTIDINHGWLVRIAVDHDDFMSEPWREEDGHGEVSDWTTRKKHPGELELCKDRDSKRYYDFAQAVRTARKDGWGCQHSRNVRHRDGSYSFKSGHRTKGEAAACAARQDFERLRAWCRDEWSYIRLDLKLIAPIGDVVDRDSLGGIESDGDYWKQEAASMANTMIDQLGNLRTWYATAKLGGRLEQRRSRS